MMLRNLIAEMNRRRLLPVAAIAVLVAVIAPLLFLKGAPDNAPGADSAAPAAAKPAKLPARAARLLAANDGDASKGSAKGNSHDPFNPPAVVRAAAAKSVASASKTSAGGSTAQPKPSVVKTPPVASSPSKTPASKSTPSSSKSGSKSTTRTYSVDVRYGKKKDSKIRRAIPRYQGFYIHGKLVAVFVKYSPSRNKAVFAVAPGLHISGPIKCRVQDGVCRYLDIPAGSHVRLTMVTANRVVVARRLDVVHTKARTSGAATKATAASTRNNRACLAGKLLAMKPGAPFVARDACAS